MIEIPGLMEYKGGLAHREPRLVYLARIRDKRIHAYKMSLVHLRRYISKHKEVQSCVSIL